MQASKTSNAATRRFTRASRSRKQLGTITRRLRQASRTLVAALAVIGLALGFVSVANAEPVELGGQVGEPTGLSAKFWTSQNTAVTTAAAWSFQGADAVQLHADVTMHDFDLFDVDRGELPLYYGLGGRILIEDRDDDRLGFRVPVGLAYLFESAPITLFGEAVPVMDVTPATDFTMNGAVGVRFVLR